MLLGNLAYSSVTRMVLKFVNRRMRHRELLYSLGSLSFRFPISRVNHAFATLPSHLTFSDRQDRDFRRFLQRESGKEAQFDDSASLWVE